MRVKARGWPGKVVFPTVTFVLMLGSMVGDAFRSEAPLKCCVVIGELEVHGMEKSRLSLMVGYIAPFSFTTHLRIQRICIYVKMGGEGSIFSCSFWKL